MKNHIKGKLRLEITCADAAFLLNALNTKNVLMEDISLQDELTLCITVEWKDFSRLQNICDKQGAVVKILSKNGLFWEIKSALMRPVPVIFLCLTVILFCFLPSRVLFVSVQGNITISTNQILEAAERCGIVFGASRRQVRSEKMKNALLQEIPELQWAGINTSGCTAIISVREKTTQNISEDNKLAVSSIIASRDGVIQHCTVYQGNSLCSVGQAVREGQVLVSGYIDCGIITKTTRADAEIKALTFREIEAISPAAALTRGTQTKSISLYSLRIGKKRIKFYKDSGNSDTSCDKIYMERYVQLPGGFRLPVVVIKETICFYDIAPNKSASNSSDWMADYADKYLQNTMIAGEIISKNTEIYPIDKAVVLSGQYACLEMIGQVRYEQTMTEGE